MCVFKCVCVSVRVVPLSRTHTFNTHTHSVFARKHPGEFDRIIPCEMIEAVGHQVSQSVHTRESVSQSVSTTSQSVSAHTQVSQSVSQSVNAIGTASQPASQPASQSVSQSQPRRPLSLMIDTHLRVHTFTLNTHTHTYSTWASTSTRWGGCSSRRASSSWRPSPRPRADTPSTSR